MTTDQDYLIGLCQVSAKKRNVMLSKSVIEDFFGVQKVSCERTPVRSNEQVIGELAPFALLEIRLETLAPFDVVWKRNARAVVPAAVARLRSRSRLQQDLNSKPQRKQGPI